MDNKKKKKNDILPIKDVLNYVFYSARYSIQIKI